MGNQYSGSVVDRPRQGAELRRTDREEGLRLLYGAALDVARQNNQLPPGAIPSFEHSTLERGRFKVRSAEEKILITVTLHDARQMLAYRRELARKILSQTKLAIRSDNPGYIEKRQLRIQKPEIRAIAWAISTGRRVPAPPKRKLETLTSVLLLLCCIVPGVLYIFDGQRRRKVYQADLDGLVQRWRMEGKPDPSDSFFAHYHL